VEWGDGSGAPTVGRSRIFLGIDDDGQLHVRVFDSRGEISLDRDESQLTDFQLPFLGSLISNLKSIISLWSQIPDAEAKEAFLVEQEFGLNLFVQIMVGELPLLRVFRGSDPEKANTDGDRWADHEEALLGTDPATAGYKITIQFDYLQFNTGDADDGDIGNGLPGEVESSFLGGADVDLNAYIRRYDPNSTRLFNLGELEEFFDPNGDISIWSSAKHVNQGAVEKFQDFTPRSTTFELADGQAFSIGVLLKEIDNIDTISGDYVQVILGDYNDGGVEVKVDGGTAKPAIFTASDIKDLLEAKDSQVGIFSLVFEFTKANNTSPNNKGNNDKMAGKMAFKLIVE
jgi:hypothetical protein